MTTDTADIDIESDQAEAAASRRSQRAAIRREIATIEVTLERVRELQEIVQRLDADDERAADSHQSVTGPLQTELEQLDQRHIDRILAGKQLSAADTARRREILQSIADENVKLEDTIQANKRARRPLEKQIHEQEKLTPKYGVLHDRLVRTASEPLQAKLFVAKRRHVREHARVNFAKKSIAENTSWMHLSARTNDHGDPSTYESRIRRWQAELDDATEAMAEAEAHSEALRQEMINEA